MAGKSQLQLRTHEKNGERICRGLNNTPDDGNEKELKTEVNRGRRPAKKASNNVRPRGQLLITATKRGPSRGVRVCGGGDPSPLFVPLPVYNSKGVTEFGLGGPLTLLGV